MYYTCLSRALTVYEATYESITSQNNALLVFCYTVRTVLPLFPFGYLDLGIVGRSEAKVWIDDHFVHLRHSEERQTQLQLQLYGKMVSITHEYLI